MQFDKETKPAESPPRSLEHATEVNLPAYDDDAPVECPPHTTESKLITKIDFRVIPFLCIMYLLAFLDRVNIANANVFGLSEDLGLTGTRYNSALVVFFVPYVLFEIPSNILLKKFKPHVWLSINMFGFGLVTLLQGFVQNYAGLCTTRFFLGVFETGMFPGAFYLIGMWYRRNEAQRRYSFFFNSTTLAGAFGGLLAAAIGKMNGINGYSGWRYIFILEGALTAVVAIFLFFCLPDFPEDVKWLTEDEKAFVSARLRADQGNPAAERNITLRDVGRVFKDYKVILGGLMYFGLVVTAYGYAYFAPGIFQTYGYGPIQTQLHSVPPWVVAFVLSMTFAFFSDRTRHRFGFAIAAICVAIVGYGILISIHDNTPVQTFGLYAVASGSYTAMPIIVCWFNMNLGGHHRRSIGSGWQVGFGNIGGIVAVFAFLKKDAPRFIPGYSISISFAIGTCPLTTDIFYKMFLFFENR
ncbi:major facilitator superfamily transporter [Colletotrichum graminicola M1.001]|uniref:Major facilitator superfamily transporter n=1 Tax=Colletotrichum graminicola (strain M1.001 / M2 / FGSC 10212) TaxID=645133 RepID=E3QXS7_COLGM|nr:major facilitator superfamily transporter [Colletotrichum graminicola M1.001]EFQ35628.1 major facilitator superfamily transporter [Colletotrichum graminicola M1.001]